MKYGTSSCKRRALAKDLGRFWPVWVGYCLCLIFIQILQSSDDLTYWYASNISGTLPIMGFLNLIYGWVAAQMLFGDLFNARMCQGLHALPLKREHWFSAHIRAGMLFSLIPTTLMTGFSEAVIFLYSDMVNGWQIPLLWWAGTNLQYLFFFGLAVFCVMCAGNRFAMTVIYGMLNFFSMLVVLLVDQLYTPLLPGVVTQTAVFELLCPVWQIGSTRFIDCERIPTGRTYLDTAGIEQREFIGQFTVPWESWIYIAILAVLGILLMLLARQAYKKRKLECAGDFMAQRWMAPVFQVVFTVLCAAGFHGVFYIFFGSYRGIWTLMTIGLLTGWFAGRMFLERTTRVFRLKNFAGLILLTAVMAGSLYATKLDPLGIATWLPRPGDVTSVSLGLQSRQDFTTEDPEQIRDLIRIHALAMENPVETRSYYEGPATSQEKTVMFTLTYTLPNGWVTQREYTVRAEGEIRDLIAGYCSRPEVVLSMVDFQSEAELKTVLKTAQIVQVSGHAVDRKYMTEEFLGKLSDAILADCRDKTLVQHSVFHPDTPIVEGPTADTSIHNIWLDINGEDFFAYITVYSDSRNILQLLETTNVMDAIRTEQMTYYGK